MKTPPIRDLSHLPGSRGLPLLGHTLAFARDARGLMQRMSARFGPDFRVQLFGYPVFLVGEPDAVKEVLTDREERFSNRLGWDHDLGRLFAGGLMLRDFGEHRQHRRLLTGAFRTEKIRDYAAVTSEVVADRLDRWQGRSERRLYPRLYPEIKRLSLDVAARVFLGIPLGPQAERLNRAFTHLVEASVALIKREVPGLPYHCGMRSRRLLESFLTAEIPRRRASGGEDLFSQLCLARDEGGLGDREIVDHMIFFLMAAHDTLASALTTSVWLLIQHPAWQERLRDEASPASSPSDGSPTVWVLREALRLYPPVPFLARRTVAPCTVGAHDLPANAALAVSPLITHFLAGIWERPAEFDPERFSEARSEHRRHSHAWYPFGGGAHMCLGMHLAEVQAAIILGALLRRFRLVAPPGYRPRMTAVPFPKPKDGLPTALVPCQT